MDGNLVIRAAGLGGFEWLDHGFGTRHSEGWELADETVTLRQVHSGRVVVAENGPGCLGEGDALITNRRGVRLAIRTADCVPLLFADAHHRAVAAVHAGWRGTAAAISKNTVADLKARFGSAAGDLHVAIGPAIGACCYKVGEEVMEALGAWLVGTNAGSMIDLAEVNRRQLRECGIPDNQIYLLGVCTRCDRTQFHSFRRDGERAGRMVSAIWLR